MKIISWNVNGLRAVYRKNFLGWFKKADPDILCLQELKLQKEQLPSELLKPSGYQAFFSFAAKKGYSGVAVFSKKKPKKVEYSFCFASPPQTRRGLREGVELYQHPTQPLPSSLGRANGRFDNEGRFLQLDFKNFTLINLYLPHGGRGKENLVYKLEVYKFLTDYLKKQIVIPACASPKASARFAGASARRARRAKAGIQVNESGSRIESGMTPRDVILIGDFNIAHTELDLARPKQNQNNIMFTPEERRQLDKIVKLGFTDTFRLFHKDGGHYTWWPYFANARARNLGWRIDYCFTSKSLTPKVKEAFIMPEAFGSDHCPIGIDMA